MTKRQKKTLFRILLSAVFCLAAAIASTVFSPNLYIKLALYLVPYFIIGYDVLFSAARNILHGQVFDEQFLMSVATVGAFAIGEYPEAVLVMLFYQVGELFQSIAVGKSRRSIAALMDIRPDTATVLRDGEEVTLSPEEVNAGEILIIRPGERIPLDGEIVEGTTSVDTAALTGESLPAEKAVGDKVVSGSVNLTGLVRVRAESVYEGSTVARILELVESSTEKKTKYENFITRFARYYTPCVVVGAILLATVPPLFLGQMWSEWVERALTFLVISCPCALVVSVPMSFFCGIGSASRQGILIKGSNFIEALSRVDTFVFDKTGTLTKGRFHVEDICPREIEESELLYIAASAESYSTHPIGESIVAEYGNIDRSRIGEIREIAGFGVEATVDGKKYFVGSTRLMEKLGVSCDMCARAGTQVHIAKENEYLGYILVADEIKPDAESAVSGLKRVGIEKTVMLTGDTEAVAASVGDRVGVDEVRSGLLPQDKVSALEGLIEKGSRVAFVGDGINDAPVLSRADVGIAMGALGSDAAIESADIVLMDDKPSKLPTAVKIAKKTMNIVKQNIWFILAVKALILALGALGIANMWIAIFGDVGVMVIAVLNSMRAMKI